MISFVRWMTHAHIIKWSPLSIFLEAVTWITHNNHFMQVHETFHTMHSWQEDYNKQI